ncbi:hypothetical protein [Streptomyces sp. Ag109_G2-15]|uniref:hypothetical protein n=1 Tax=Streptomyces sp. Ag109_G2-15 TaxID=1938850 RepID=UPI000BD50C0B|nr:hypothetical protein [Streptomyces sp. Ag109_G2-15]SOD82515.1 hypothetical protein SAMN06272765_0609 [Streptomyces sp. Ag109_G2-15]
MSDERKSAAITVFLGRGESPFPQRDEAAVLARFGPDDGPGLAAYAKEIVSEAAAFDIEWGDQSLSSGTAHFREEMRRRHPELTDEAVAALGWFFSYMWR